MDWFERITGFREESYGYAGTRGRLAVEGERLASRENGCSYGIGRLETVSLRELRERVAGEAEPAGKLRVQIITGGVREMHGRAEFAGALFQVASQFNLLEMTGPQITPEQGVGRYEGDHTQGPACAIAAGAATIFRNYFMPIGGHEGQTADRQADCLADVGAALGQALGLQVKQLWTMRNGYALLSEASLRAIAAHLRQLDEAGRDALRSRLRVGIQWDVEVTDGEQRPGPSVSQIFCSALPVSYCPSMPLDLWQPFAQLVLEATYEATVWAAVLNARRGASRVVLLTRVGGGVFGNDAAWIDAAMLRALRLVQGHGLDVRLVSHHKADSALLSLVKSFS